MGEDQYRNEHKEVGKLRRTIEDLSHELILSKDREEKTLAEFSAMNNELITTHRLLAKSHAELKASKEEAERANREKSKFLAMVSHEIRAPLGGIIGITELLRLSQTDPDQLESLSVIADSADYLMGMINNLLDMSRIEAGKMELAEGTLDLRSLLGRVLQLLSRTAGKRGNRLRLEIDPAVASNLWGDGAKITQIVINLVNNGIKFTENGEIAISLKMLADDGDVQHLRFEIADSGIGISAENKGKLFRPYTQISSGGSFEGTGLGLSISKAMVELMDGSIDVESEPGEGSTFWFELPVRRETRPAGEKRESDTAADPGRVRFRPVLLAEDHPLNSTLMVKQLERLGIREVTLAGTGREAVEAWRKRRYALVLLDSQLPEMSGLEAAAVIRRLEGETGRPRTPIVAVTGDGTAESRERCLEAGMDDWAVKPLKLDHLKDLLDRWMPESPESPENPESLENPESPESPESPAVPVINRETLSAISEVDGGSDYSMLALLLEMFKADTPGRLAALEDAVRRKKADEAAAVAHSLKSGSISLGADYFAQLCAEIERLAKEGELAEAAGKLPELTPAYKETVSELERLV